MADKQVKVDTPVQFNDTSTDSTEYVWNFGDGGTSTVKSPSHTYTTISPVGAPYIVTHSVVNSCDGSTSTCTSKTVEVIAELPPSGGGSSAVMIMAAAVIGFMMITKK